MLASELLHSIVLPVRRQRIRRAALNLAYAAPDRIGHPMSPHAGDQSSEPAIGSSAFFDPVDHDLAEATEQTLERSGRDVPEHIVVIRSSLDKLENKLPLNLRWLEQ